jgi:hypothetical protein
MIREKKRKSHREEEKRKKERHYIKFFFFFFQNFSSLSHMSSNGSMLNLYTSSQQRQVPQQRPRRQTAPQSTPPATQIISVNVVITIATVGFCLLTILFIVGGLILLNRANDAMESVEALKTKVNDLTPRARIVTANSDRPSTKLLGGSAATELVNKALLQEPDLALPRRAKQPEHLVCPFQFTTADQLQESITKVVVFQFENNALDLNSAKVCCFSLDNKDAMECIPKQLLTLSLLTEPESDKVQKAEITVADGSYAGRRCWLLVLPNE